MRLFSMYRWVRERHMIGIRGRNFLEAPWAGGVVLLGCVIVAMLLANLPGTSLYYRHLLETDLSLMVYSPDGLIDWVFPRGMTVEKLINDGLMVIFFFAVGLEIKREIVCGQLSSARQAILPVLAAAGGMLAPAIIFLFFNHGTIAANGWGIPTATDIALPSASFRCWATACRFRSKYSSRHWPSPTTWGPSWSSRSSTGGRCR